MRPGMPAGTIWDTPLTLVPAWRETAGDGNAWPAPRTSFVGREDEVARVRQLLARGDVRFVTLTGPGGVGKTRIAIQAAASRRPAAYFVDLAEVREPALVLPAIAAALGVRPDGRSVVGSLQAMLRESACLLVLDNFEHVLAAAPGVLALLDACPHVTVLTTSRAVLQIAGEQVVDIRPFPVTAGPAAAAAEIGTMDACRLFQERAQALDPTFALTPENAATVVTICAQLDGLPLAIELAASWVAVLSLRELRQQLERRLALATDERWGTPRRHQSLRETIAWSYGLLRPVAQTLFRRLAVFTGGWTLAAAVAVGGDDALDVLPALRVLVANSLVRREDSPGGESKYAFLETVREFGAEQLAASAEAEAIRHRHAAFFLAYAERWAVTQDTSEREVGLDQLAAEQGNLHAALTWALAAGNATIAQGLSGALLGFWQFRFHSREGQAWVRQALALPGEVPPEVQRRAIYCAGTLAYMQGERAVAAAYFVDAWQRYAGDDVGMTGRLELARGRLAWDDQDLSQALAWFTAAEQRFATVGDAAGLATSQHYRGLLQLDAGEFAGAERLLLSAVKQWDALGFSWELTQCIPGHLADVARAAGRLDAAVTAYQACLAGNWPRQDMENVAWSLSGLAMIWLDDDQIEPAVRLMALAERCEALTGAPLTPHIRRDHDEAARRCAARVGAERYAATLVQIGQADLAVEIDAALALRRGPGRRPPRPPVPASLTPRERDVLRLLAAGQSNQVIADALFLSLGTVKIHVTHVLAKLGVKSRAAATDYAHRHNLI